MGYLYLERLMFSTVFNLEVETVYERVQTLVVIILINESLEIIFFDIE